METATAHTNLSAARESDAVKGNYVELWDEWAREKERSFEWNYMKRALNESETDKNVFGWFTFHILNLNEKKSNSGENLIFALCTSENPNGNTHTHTHTYIFYYIGKFNLHKQVLLMQMLMIFYVRTFCMEQSVAKALAKTNVTHRAHKQSRKINEVTKSSYGFW